MFRASLCDEAGHSMDGSEALVSGTDGTFAFLFEMIEKAAQHITRQVEDLKTIDVRLLPGACIGQQERKCIAVTALCVPAEAAFRDQMIKEEALYPRTKQCIPSHEPPPAWRTVRNRGLPVRAVRSS